ncbi:hypothetical protein BKP35_15715 [Anaerobacillus arseniciselenatis]|uniref:Flagellar Assembly Protein A N-terminal region domain-containing protein n=1 Tax=Anaerobacillus arseniciselenatis TaxID=85682 RepID=A0A1S2LBQ3_9BACI|nr:FapA family protein [Anaerobacillus arseniciselenatis]OIJ09928.1 hypothetical protein BKP35_15715 [Anaerobacillus arseniciselenatis]
MSHLDDFFEIQVDKKKLKATITQRKKLEQDDDLTLDELKSFVNEHGIVFGVKEELLQKITLGEATLPLAIAEGLSPVDGVDAFLKPIFPETKEIENKEDLRKVDLKQVLNIPSVTHGQIIGEKIPATAGTSGKNIFGEEISAKPGKDFKLRTGKNTRIDDSGLKLIATTDGQMSVEPKVIHVFPVFEVNGDLDLKVGNISFIGSVEIRGNVPAGFEIKSKGDIKIHGTVESAILNSEGSIFVSAGIVGQGQGLIKAKGDLHTSFINQANVEVEGDINVIQSILHSNVQAGGNIFCNRGKGNIVGGNVSAAKNITVKEVGNTHNTKTSLYLGVNHEIMKKEKIYSDHLKKSEEDLQKLLILLKNLNEKEKSTSLSAKEKIMKLRIRNTINQANDTMIEAKEKLEDLKEIFSQSGGAFLTVENKIFSNVDVHFGKYRRKIVASHQFVKIYLEDGEIKVGPL